MEWVREDLARRNIILDGGSIDNVDFLYVAANHGIVGGNHTDFIMLAFGNIGN